MRKQSEIDDGFGRGVRYRVRIGRTETNLFDEQNGRWFVEAKLQ